MGVRFPSVGISGTGQNLPASNAETIIYTVGPLVPSQDGAQVFLTWSYTLLAGTGTTSVVFRLRRGNLVTSPQLNVNPNAIPLAAGAIGLFSGVYTDSPPAATALLYSLTIVQTAATAAGVNADGGLLAFAL